MSVSQSVLKTCKDGEQQNDRTGKEEDRGISKNLLLLLYVVHKTSTRTSDKFINTANLIVFTRLVKIYKTFKAQRKATPSLMPT